MSHDLRSLIYWWANTWSNKSGLSEHSCSHLHIEQWVFVKSHKTLTAVSVAFCCYSSFFIALVIGPVIFSSLLKFKSFWSETVSLSAPGLNNFLMCITLRILVFPLGSNKRVLASLISVIFAGPYHLGVNLGFLPNSEKCSYHTKLSIWKLCGNAVLSKLSLILSPWSLQNVFGKETDFL